MNDNIAVKIVGDASGVAPAIDYTKGEIASIAPILESLNATMMGLTAQMAKGFETGAAGAQTLKNGLHTAKAATDEETFALTRMVMKLHEGAESVRTFQMRAKEFAELYVALFAVEAVAHWAEALGEAAEKVEHLAAQTGMTTSQVQALSGAATMSGTNIDALAKGLAMMDNKAVIAAGHSSTSAKAFQAMGIAANDSSTNMDRLLKIADKFKGMADGPTKTALAMQLFGKSGREMIPFLNQGSAAIQQLMDKTKDYGAVNEAAVEQGARLAASVNESKVAWEGLKQTLTQAFGPLLTQVVDGFNQLVQSMHQSYESGGAVKIIFDAITEVIRGCGEILHDVYLAFASFFGTTGAQGVDWGKVIKAVIDGTVLAFKAIIATVAFVVDAFIAGFHLMKAGAEEFLARFVEATGGIRMKGTELGEFMKVLGKVCEDALMLRWGSIVSDWNAGMESVRQAVAAKAQQIVAETHQMRSAVQADLAAVSGTAQSFRDLIAGLNAPAPGPKHDAFQFHFGGGGGDAPDITSPGKGPKEKKPKAAKDDLVQQLEAELEAKKTAWAMEQDAQGTAQEYSLQSEADYWAQALQRTNLSTKDKLAIEKKYLAARAALKKEEIGIALEGYQTELEQAGANWDKKLAILRTEQAYVTKMYGAESKEAKQAAKEVIKAEQEKAKQLRELDQAIAKAKEDAAMAGVDAAEAAAQFEVDMGRETQGQMLAQERQFESQRYQIRLKALDENLRLAALDPNTSPAKLQEIHNQIAQLERTHQAKLTEIDRKATLERTQIARGAINQFASGWASALAQMATLQKGFAATIKSLWQTIQQTIASALESIIQGWLQRQLAALLLGKAQQTAAAEGEIGANAAVAASGAYAATAAIPVVGPELAPAAAATAYAGAMSWMGALSVPGFDVGAWSLSKDQLAVVHSNEMIIPASLAGGMRALFTAVSNDNARVAANDSGGGGDVHLHLHGQLIHNPRQLEQWFEKNRHAVGAGVRAFVRQGGNTSPYR